MEQHKSNRLIWTSMELLTLSPKHLRIRQRAKVCVRINFYGIL